MTFTKLGAGHEINEVVMASVSWLFTLEEEQEKDNIVVDHAPKVHYVKGKYARIDC